MKIWFFLYFEDQFGHRKCRKLHSSTLTDLHNADAIPSSEAFDVIQQSLTADPNEQKTAVKQGGAIFAFTIKNGGTTDSWHIDLKNKGVVGKGTAPEGQKATGKQKPLA